MSAEPEALRHSGDAAALEEQIEELQLRVRQAEERRRALIHIMGDLNESNRRLGDQRKAMLHILKDSHRSNLKLEDSRKAMIHIMGDLRSTTQVMERREQELRDKQEQLVQAGKLATLGELTTGVAHELNNPLNNIGLYVGNVIDRIHMGELSTESAREDLEKAMEQVRKATEIISHLRTFGRAAPVTFEAVDVDEVIERALSLMQEQLRLRAIDVDLDLCPDALIVQGNPIQLEQVFINLLTNARDALSEVPEARKKIRIVSSLERDRIRIVFEDTGPGIPAEIAKRVFDPFFTTKEVGTGTGLGLSITYSIVKEHGGDISLSKTPGGGATFTVEVPVYSDAAEEAAPMNDARILLVDDDVALLEALPQAILLRMERVQIDTSETATDALERITEVDYDAIVTDIKMPVMDGLALLEEIGKVRPGTPTLLITGHGEHDLAVRALRGGAYDFVAEADRPRLLHRLARARHRDAPARPRGRAAAARSRAARERARARGRRRLPRRRRGRHPALEPRGCGGHRAYAERRPRSARGRCPAGLACCLSDHPHRLGPGTGEHRRQDAPLRDRRPRGLALHLRRRVRGRRRLRVPEPDRGARARRAQGRVRRHRLA